jgi:hypothetical protein
MAERVRAGALLRQARALLEPAGKLSLPTRAAWRTDFAAGGAWMRQALAYLRGAAPACPLSNLNALGLVKYGLAGGAALAWTALAVLLGHPWAACLCLAVFYAVEAQMVFLFPLALDGSPRPFRDALRWTRSAGGTLAVMRVVGPLAGSMVFGGLAGGGFVRSWCAGCLAVCIWYERLRPAADIPEAA